MKKKKWICVFLIITLVVLQQDCFCVAEKNKEVQYIEMQASQAINSEDRFCFSSSFHTGYVTQEGELYMWGANGYGQVGIGIENKYDNEQCIKKPVKVLDDVISISLGNCHSGAITKNGDLYEWGYDGTQNGEQSINDKPKKVLENIRKIVFKGSISLAISNNDELFIWGEYGEHYSNTKIIKEPTKIMDNVKDIFISDVNYGHGISDYQVSMGVLTNDNSLYTWGYNGYNSDRLGYYTEGKLSTIPQKILDNVIDCSLGIEHGAAILKDGSLYMWGNNDYGELGLDIVGSITPVKVMDNVKSVTLGYWCNAAITEDGALYVWGYRTASPKKVMNDVYYAKIVGSYCLAITKNNILYGFYATGSEFRPKKEIENVITVTGINGYAFLDHNWGKEEETYSFGAITQNGDLYTWGDNRYYNLGNGTRLNNSEPTKIFILGNQEDDLPEDGQKFLSISTRIKANSIRKDEIGIVGADVNLYNHNNQKIGSAKTDKLGNVSFENLEGGHPYTVKISASGYQAYEKKDIEFIDGEDFIELSIFLEDGKDGFTLGYDTNSFQNIGDHFLIQNHESDLLGKAYSVSKDNYLKLCQGENWIGKNRILDVMNYKNSKWFGACQGISTSMLLADCGKFDVAKYNSHDKDQKNESYSDLQIPNTDNNLLSDINYYQLAQHKSQHRYTALTWNPLKILGLRTDGATEAISNDDFFQSLIKTAKQGKPFVFCFGFKDFNGDTKKEKDVGHAVVGLNLDYETEKEYVIKCYDPNVIKSYMYFVLSKDYRNMYFCAGSSNGTAFYRNKDGKFEWKYFRYLTQEQIYKNIEILSCNASQKFEMKSKDFKEEQNYRSFLYIDSNSPFCIENIYGNKLIYDGNSYSGDMEVYSISTDNHEINEKMVYEIDNSSKYFVTQFDAGTEIQIGNNDHFYSVSPSVQGRIIFTDKGIEMQNMDASGAYSFESEIATRQAGDEIIRVSGKAEGNSSLAADGHDIILNSEIRLSGITAEKITEDGTTSVSSGNGFKNGVVGTGSEEKFQISTKSFVENIILEFKENLQDSDIVQFHAVVLPDTASNKTLSWTTDNPSVALVDNNGLVTAVSAGQATITASSTDGSNVSASCVITVTKPDNAAPPDDNNNSENNPGGNDSNNENSGENNSTGNNPSGGGSSNGSSSGGSTTGGNTSGGGSSNGSSPGGGTTGGIPSGGGSSGGGSTGGIPSGGGSTGGNSTGGNSSGNGTDNSNGNSSVDNNKPDDSMQVKLLYYIIEFNANGGTKLSRRTMTLLNDDNIGILPKVQCENYIFNGWYTQKSGGTKVTSSTVLNAGTTLFAQWIKVNKPSKVKAPSLKSPKAGQIVVSFKKITGADGYELAYSTNKKFPSSSMKKTVSDSVKKTLGKLKSGKKYYVRIRAYKTDSTGKKVYGAYSEVRSIKVK